METAKAKAKAEPEKVFLVVKANEESMGILEPELELGGGKLMYPSIQVVCPQCEVWTIVLSKPDGERTCLNGDTFTLTGGKPS